jgi:hypothetical protein
MILSRGWHTMPNLTQAEAAKIAAVIMAYVQDKSDE